MAFSEVSQLLDWPPPPTFIEWMSYCWPTHTKSDMVSSEDVRASAMWALIVATLQLLVARRLRSGFRASERPLERSTGESPQRESSDALGRDTAWA